MNSYYLDRLIPMFLVSGIVSEDALDEVSNKFQKFEDTLEEKEYESIQSWIENYWEIEKNFINHAYDIHKKLTTSIIKSDIDLPILFQDPALNQNTMVPLFKENNQMQIDETSFDRCPKCSGRVFPQFNFCPYCGFIMQHPAEQEQVLPNNDPGLGLGLGPGRGMGNQSNNPPHYRRNMGLECPVEKITKQVYADNYFEDPENGIIITEDEIRKNAKKLEKHMPGDN